MSRVPYRGRDQGFRNRDPSGFRDWNPDFRDRDQGFSDRDPGFSDRDPGFRDREQGFRDRTTPRSRSDERYRDGQYSQRNASTYGWTGRPEQEEQRGHSQPSSHFPQREYGSYRQGEFPSPSYHSYHSADQNHFNHPPNHFNHPPNRERHYSDDRYREDLRRGYNNEEYMSQRFPSPDSYRPCRREGDPLYRTERGPPFRTERESSYSSARDQVPNNYDRNGSYQPRRNNSREKEESRHFPRDQNRYGPNSRNQSGSQTRSERKTLGQGTMRGERNCTERLDVDPDRDRSQEKETHHMSNRKVVDVKREDESVRQNANRGRSHEAEVRETDLKSETSNRSSGHSPRATQSGETSVSGRNSGISGRNNYVNSSSPNVSSNKTVRSALEEIHEKLKDIVDKVNAQQKAKVNKNSSKVSGDIASRDVSASVKICNEQRGPDQNETIAISNIKLGQGHNLQSEQDTSVNDVNIVKMANQQHASSGNRNDTLMSTVTNSGTQGCGSSKSKKMETSSYNGNKLSCANVSVSDKVKIKENKNVVETTESGTNVNEGCSSGKVQDAYKANIMTDNRVVEGEDQSCDHQEDSRKRNENHTIESCGSHSSKRKGCHEDDRETCDTEKEKTRNKPDQNDWNRISTGSFKEKDGQNHGKHPSNSKREHHNNTSSNVQCCSNINDTNNRNNSIDKHTNNTSEKHDSYSGNDKLYCIKKSHKHNSNRSHEDSNSVKNHKHSSKSRNDKPSSGRGIDKPTSSTTKSHNNTGQNGSEKHENNKTGSEKHTGKSIVDNSTSSKSEKHDICKAGSEKSTIKSETNTPTFGKSESEKHNVSKAGSEKHSSKCRNDKPTSSKSESEKIHIRKTGSEKHTSKSDTDKPTNGSGSHQNTIKSKHKKHTSKGSGKSGSEKHTAESCSRSEIEKHTSKDGSEKHPNESLRKSESEKHSSKHSSKSKSERHNSKDSSKSESEKCTSKSCSKSGNSEKHTKSEVDKHRKPNVHGDHNKEKDDCNKGENKIHHKYIDVKHKSDHVKKDKDKMPESEHKLKVHHKHMPKYKLKGADEKSKKNEESSENSPKHQNIKTESGLSKAHKSETEGHHQKSYESKSVKSLKGGEKKHGKEDAETRTKHLSGTSEHKSSSKTPKGKSTNRNKHERDEKSEQKHHDSENEDKTHVKHTCVKDNNRVCESNLKTEEKRIDGNKVETEKSNKSISTREKNEKRQKELPALRETKPDAKKKAKVKRNAEKSKHNKNHTSKEIASTPRSSCDDIDKVLEEIDMVLMENRKGRGKAERPDKSSTHSNKSSTKKPLAHQGVKSGIESLSSDSDSDAGSDSMLKSMESNLGNIKELRKDNTKLFWKSLEIKDTKVAVKRLDDESINRIRQKLKENKCLQEKKKKEKFKRIKVFSQSSSESTVSPTESDSSDVCRHVSVSKLKVNVPVIGSDTAESSSIEKQTDINASEENVVKSNVEDEGILYSWNRSGTLHDHTINNSQENEHQTIERGKHVNVTDVASRLKRTNSADSNCTARSESSIRSEMLMDKTVNNTEENEDLTSEQNVGVKDLRHTEVVNQVKRTNSVDSDCSTRSVSSAKKEKRTRSVGSNCSNRSASSADKVKRRKSVDSNCSTRSISSVNQVKRRKSVDSNCSTRSASSAEKVKRTNSVDSNSSCRSASIADKVKRTNSVDSNCSTRSASSANQVKRRKSVDSNCSTRSASSANQVKRRKSVDSNCSTRSASSAEKVKRTNSVDSNCSCRSASSAGKVKRTNSVDSNCSTRSASSINTDDELKENPLLGVSRKTLEINLDEQGGAKTAALEKLNLNSITTADEKAKTDTQESSLLFQTQSPPKISVSQEGTNFFKNVRNVTDEDKANVEGSRQVDSQKYGKSLTDLKRLKRRHSLQQNTVRKRKSRTLSAYVEELEESGVEGDIEDNDITIIKLNLSEHDGNCSKESGACVEQESSHNIETLEPETTYTCKDTDQIVDTGSAELLLQGNMKLEKDEKQGNLMKVEKHIKSEKDEQPVKLEKDEKPVEVEIEGSRKLLQSSKVGKQLEGFGKKGSDTTLKKVDELKQEDEENKPTVIKDDEIEPKIKHEPDWSLRGYTQEPDVIFLSDDDDEMVMFFSQPVINLDSDSDGEIRNLSGRVKVKQETSDWSDDGSSNSDLRLLDLDYDISSSNEESDMGSDFEPEVMFGPELLGRANQRMISNENITPESTQAQNFNNKSTIPPQILTSTKILKEEASLTGAGTASKDGGYGKKYKPSDVTSAAENDFSSSGDEIMFYTAFDSQKPKSEKTEHSPKKQDRTSKNNPYDVATQIPPASTFRDAKHVDTSNTMQANDNLFPTNGDAETDISDLYAQDTQVDCSKDNQSDIDAFDFKSEHFSDTELPSEAASAYQAETQVPENYSNLFSEISDDTNDELYQMQTQIAPRDNVLEDDKVVDSGEVSDVPDSYHDPQLEYYKGVEQIQQSVAERLGITVDYSFEEEALLDNASVSFGDKNKADNSEDNTAAGNWRDIEDTGTDDDKKWNNNAQTQVNKEKVDGISDDAYATETQVYFGLEEVAEQQTEDSNLDCSLYAAQTQLGQNSYAAETQVTFAPGAIDEQLEDSDLDSSLCAAPTQLYNTCYESEAQVNVATDAVEDQLGDSDNPLYAAETQMFTKFLESDQEETLEICDDRYDTATQVDRSENSNVEEDPYIAATQFEQNTAYLFNENQSTRGQKEDHLKSNSLKRSNLNRDTACPLPTKKSRTAIEILPQRQKSVTEKRSSGILIKPGNENPSNKAKKTVTLDDEPRLPPPRSDIFIQNASKQDMWLSKNISNTKVLSGKSQTRKRRRTRSREDPGESLTAKMKGAISQLKDRNFQSIVNPNSIADPAKRPKPAATVATPEVEDADFPTCSQIVRQGLPVLNDPGVLLKKPSASTAQTVRFASRSAALTESMLSAPDRPVKTSSVSVVTSTATVSTPAVSTTVTYSSSLTKPQSTFSTASIESAVNLAKQLSVSSRQKHSSGSDLSKDKHTSKSGISRDKHSYGTSSSKGKHSSVPSSSNNKHSSLSSSYKDKHTGDSSSSKDKHTGDSTSSKDKHTGDSNSSKDKHTGDSNSSKDKHTSDSNSSKDKHTSDSKDKHSDLTSSSKNKQPSSSKDKRPVVPCSSREKHPSGASLVPSLSREKHPCGASLVPSSSGDKHPSGPSLGKSISVLKDRQTSSASNSPKETFEKDSRGRDRRPSGPSLFRDKHSGAPKSSRDRSPLEASASKDSKKVASSGSKAWDQSASLKQPDSSKYKPSTIPDSSNNLTSTSGTSAHTGPAVAPQPSRAGQSSSSGTVVQRTNSKTSPLYDEKRSSMPLRDDQSHMKTGGPRPNLMLKPGYEGVKAGVSPSMYAGNKRSPLYGDNMRPSTSRMAATVASHQPTFQSPVHPLSRDLRPAQGRSPGFGSPATRGPPREVSSMNWNRFLSVILKWSPLWLEERVAFSDKGKNSAPPLTGDLHGPDAREAAPYPLVERYQSFKEYSESFMLPLLLYETWESCFKDWKERKERFSQKLLWNQEASAGERTLELILLGISSKADRRAGACFKEGDLVHVHLVESGSEKIWVVMGYVEKIEFDHHVDRLCRRRPEFAQIRKPDSLVLQLSLKIRKRDFNPSHEHLIELKEISSIVTTKRQFCALFALNRNPLCMDILRPENNQTYSDRAPSSIQQLQGRYNRSQSEAINTATRISSLPKEAGRICLLQGPPGTGKSHTIIGIIENILKAKGKKCCICLCAPSNAAVDELLRRLHRLKTDKTRSVNFVRLGKKNGIHPEIQQYSLDSIIEKNLRRAKQDELLKKLPSSLQEEIRNLHNKIDVQKGKLETEQDEHQKQKLRNDMKKLLKNLEDIKSRCMVDKTNFPLDPKLERDVRRNVVNNVNVIAGTLSSFGSSQIRNFQQNFDCVIIDEATQAIELDTLIPLQYGATKLILVGDPEQLAPTVLSQIAKDNKLELSLFERLHNYFTYIKDPNHNPVILLDTQYRMNSEIAKFPSSYIYEKKLLTDSSVYKRSSCELEPYILYDIQEGEEQFSQTTSSMCNLAEAYFTAELCSYIMENSSVPGKVIGIITTYSKQRKTIEAKLQEKGLQNIQVSTVDGFQGQEKHVIIMSCVRANDTGAIGFVGNRKRMNVALTRAKFAMYLVGHLELLERNDEWKALMADARERKKIIPVNERSMNKAIHHCLKPNR